MKQFVSVIIPVYNEKLHLYECIESIRGQTYPKDLIEVLLIDGLSTDGTRKIINEYGEKYQFIKMLDNPQRIVPCALNIGIKNAKGDIIIRLDAHTYYDKDYILKSVETLNKVNAANVSGPIVTLPGSDTALAKAISFASSHIFGVGNSKFRTNTKAQFVDTLAFGAFKKEIFDKLGLFNEKLARNQDIEFNYRIIRSGKKIFLNPEIKSYYYTQSTLKGLCFHSFKNGMWNLFTLAVNMRGLSIRHLIPFLFILSLLICLFLSSIQPLFFFLFISILFIYSLTCIIVSIKIGIANKYKYFFLIPIVFAMLHFSYGFGYLWGLIKMRNFKKIVVS